MVGEGASTKLLGLWFYGRLQRNAPPKRSEQMWCAICPLKMQLGYKDLGVNSQNSTQKYNVIYPCMFFNTKYLVSSYFQIFVVYKIFFCIQITLVNSQHTLKNNFVLEKLVLKACSKDFWYTYESDLVWRIQFIQIRLKFPHTTKEFLTLN